MIEWESLREVLMMITASRNLQPDYDELSSYLELNGHYLSSMTVFDEAWELYQNNA